MDKKIIYSKSSIYLDCFFSFTQTSVIWTTLELCLFLNLIPFTRAHSINVLLLVSIQIIVKVSIIFTDYDHFQDHYYTYFNDHFHVQNHDHDYDHDNHDHNHNLGIYYNRHSLLECLSTNRAFITLFQQ